MWPPTEVGVLPVPKALTMAVTAAATKASHYSTHQFVGYHFSRIATLLGIVIQICIDIEGKKMSPLLARPPGGQNRLSAVKFYLTKQMTAQKLKVGPFTASSAAIQPKG
jgi:hypothetical protein